jgi:hypothetical protein
VGRARCWAPFPFQGPTGGGRVEAFVRHWEGGQMGKTALHAGWRGRSEGCVDGAVSPSLNLDVLKQAAQGAATGSKYVADGGSGTATLSRRQRLEGTATAPPGHHFHGSRRLGPGSADDCHRPRRHATTCELNAPLNVATLTLSGRLRTTGPAVGAMLRLQTGTSAEGYSQEGNVMQSPSCWSPRSYGGQSSASSSR